MVRVGLCNLVRVLVRVLVRRGNLARVLARVLVTMNLRVVHYGAK